MIHEPVIGRGTKEELMGREWIYSQAQLPGGLSSAITIPLWQLWTQTCWKNKWIPQGRGEKGNILWGEHAQTDMGRAKGRKTYTKLFPKPVVLITCEIHDINSGTWLQFLVLPQSFECVVTTWAGSWEFSLLLSPTPKKDKEKGFSPIWNSKEKKAEPHSHEKSVLLCCANFFGVKSNQW